jgi:hypothetical protein
VGQTISVDLSQSWSNASISSFKNQNPGSMGSKRPSLWYSKQDNKVYEWGGWSYPGNFTSLFWSFTPNSSGIVDWIPAPDPSVNGLGPGSPDVFYPAFIASDTNFYALGGTMARSNDIPYIALPGFVEYNFKYGSWSNTSSTPATLSGYMFEGGAAYASGFGKAGFLIFLGGVVPDTQIFGVVPNTQVYSISTVNMSTITLYDIDTRRWYHQITTGNIPPGRLQFCSVGSTSTEGSFEM